MTSVVDKGERDIVDMTDGFDFSRTSDLNFASPKLSKSPRLAIMHAWPDGRNDGDWFKQKQHEQMVVDYAATQSTGARGFLIVAPDRDDMLELFKIEDSNFVPIGQKGCSPLSEIRHFQQRGGNQRYIFTVQQVHVSE